MFRIWKIETEDHNDITFYFNTVMVYLKYYSHWTQTPVILLLKANKQDIEIIQMAKFIDNLIFGLATLNDKD